MYKMKKRAETTDKSKAIKISRRAELTSKYLVYIILLVLGFLIVLFLYWQISWTGTVNKEVCHQSVIIRGTLPSFGGAKEYVPLKCKTEKICITSGLIGGKCEDSFGEKESVTKVKVKNIEQIEKFIAQNIIDCWSMMGEGKVLVNTDWIATTYGFGVISSDCIVCSRIAFDKKALEEKEITQEELSKIDVLKYMATHYIPGKEITYLDYIGQSHGAKISIKEHSPQEIAEKLSEVAGVDKNEKEQKEIKEELEKNIQEIEKNNKGDQTKEMAVIFMQIRAPGHAEVLENTVYTLAGGSGASFALAPGTFIKAIGTAVFWKVVIPLTVIVGTAQQINVAYNKEVAAGYCGDVMIGNEAKEGCSVVRALNYEEEDLSKYCSIIESIP